MSELVADIRGEGYCGYQTFKDGWIFPGGCGCCEARRWLVCGAVGGVGYLSTARGGFVAVQHSALSDDFV